MKTDFRTSYTDEDTRSQPLLVIQQDDDDDDEEIGKQQQRNSVQQNKKPSSSNKNSKKSYYYRDKSSGIIFLLHVFVIFCLAITSGTSFHSHSTWGAPTRHQAAILISGTILLLCLSAVMSVLWLRLLLMYSSELIGVVLWTMTGSCFLLAIFYLILVTDGIFTGIIYLLLGIFSFFYALAVQDRIPFASAVLQVACLGLQVNMPALLVVGVGSMVSPACWVLMWTAAYLGLVGARAAAVGFWRGAVAEPMMLLSLYWGIQVCTNVANVTTSGAVAEWWFRPTIDVKPHTGSVKVNVDLDLDASRTLAMKAEDTVRNALRRATTSSFGSVCLGSLVVAILQTLRSLVCHCRDSIEHHYFRGSLGIALGLQDRNRSTNPNLHNFMIGLLSILDVILGVLHRLASVFNRFAFVYVAVYGDDFGTSGRCAHDLFRSRGLDALVGDSLISNVLALGGMVSGALVGVVGWLFASNAGLKHGQVLYLSLVGLVCGYGMCAVLMHGLVVSSVATVFVCFAHDDIALKNHRPEEHEMLASAWKVAHPDYREGGPYSAADQPTERLEADLEADGVRSEDSAIRACLAVGDKAGAAYHRAKKEQHRQVMFTKNAAASASLVDRQRGGGGGGGWRNEWSDSLDLHGLFVQEAVSVTHNFLDFHRERLIELNGNRNGFIELVIVTGAGHHSENNQPKIRPAILNLLEKRQLDTEDVQYVFNSLPGDGAFKVVLSVPPESPVFAQVATVVAPEHHQLISSPSSSPPPSSISSSLDTDKVESLSLHQDSVPIIAATGSMMFQSAYGDSDGLGDSV